MTARWLGIAVRPADMIPKVEGRLGKELHLWRFCYDRDFSKEFAGLLCKVGVC